MIVTTIVLFLHPPIITMCAQLKRRNLSWRGHDGLWWNQVLYLEVNILVLVRLFNSDEFLVLLILAKTKCNIFRWKFRFWWTFLILMHLWFFSYSPKPRAIFWILCSSFNDFVDYVDYDDYDYDGYDYDDHDNDYDDLQQERPNQLERCSNALHKWGRPQIGCYHVSIIIILIIIVITWSSWSSSSSL